MQTETTLYEALEVSPLASAKVIKAAYRCLAQVNHPDKNSGCASAGERLTRINHAYAVLSDPEQRLRYDQMSARAGQPPDRRDRGQTSGPHASGGTVGATASRAFAFRPV